MRSQAEGIIKVAIAGQGRSGYGIHGTWLHQAHEEFRIVAVADQLPERRQDAEREFGATAYADYTEMLRAGGFDLFVNALPTPLHAPATIEALRGGYHVVSEKPLAGSVADVDRMYEAAVEAGRMLAPFQNNRFQPFFEKIQEIVQSGVLGEILVIRSHWGGFSRRWDWQTLQRNLGGVLFNTGPHAIDQALTLIGWDKDPQVFCRMSCHHELGGDADDLCAVTLHGPNMPLVEILLTAYLAYPQGDMYNISGTRGGLTGHATELKWKYYDAQQAPKQSFWSQWSVDRAYPREDLPWVENSWNIDEECAKSASGYTLRSFSVGTERFYRNIRDVLLHGSDLLVTIPQVRRQIAVIEDCHRQNSALHASTA